MKGKSGRPSAISSQQIGNSQREKKPVSTGWGGKGIVIIALVAGLLLIAQSSLLVAQNAPAQPQEPALSAKTAGKTMKPEDKAGKTEEKKGDNFAEREDALRKEEERLKVLRKEVDDKIDKYTKLLSKVEEALKSMETAKGERYEHLIKTYEAMPNGEAAARLSELDEPSAIKIISRMKSKKAGAVMAAMEPKKAAALTEGMMSTAKNIPTR